MAVMTGPALSGERFSVVYRIAASGPEALARARDICIEQTIEFPLALVPPGPIRDGIVGRVEELNEGDGTALATISYAVESAGVELTQFLNVVFGNTSLQPGVRVEGLDLPDALQVAFGGPRFGVAGLRALLGVPRRPLLCTALKPMGLGVAELAEVAYRFALGGIDLIKDDHGLADQPFAPFAERAERCAEAVRRANAETGLSCLYVPNVGAPADRLMRRARQARALGAGGLLVAPGLMGWDGMRALAADPAIGLPILCHPALLGGFIAAPDGGIAHGVLFGQLARLAGADATIYPNWGGRFAFSRAACLDIAQACRAPGPLPPIVPAPGGGMDLGRVPEMLAAYGNDVVLLIGGALHQQGPDLVGNCRRFRALAEAAAA